MIRIKISSITDKARQNIIDTFQQHKPRDIMWLKKMGTSLKLDPDGKFMEIILDPCSLKAIQQAIPTKEHRAQYEKRVAIEKYREWEETLKGYGLHKGKDYHMELFKDE